jgi:hypothetical protein
MASIDDIISSAKLPEKTIELCLRGDLQAQWEDLERQFQAVQEQDGDTLGGGAHARDLADRMAGVAEEMRSHQVTFLFRGLSHRAYSDLLKAHKAPEEKRDEAVDGLDWGTYPTALIAACAVDPAMSYEQAEKLSEVVSNKQFDDLFAAALSVNRAAVSVPFSYAASAIRASSDPRRKQPEPTTSPDPVSSGESLAG